MIKSGAEPQRRMLLVLEESSLRNEAWFAYAFPALGIVLGGVAPALFMAASNPWLNGASLAGAALGTLLALRLSKRHSRRVLLAGLRIVERGSNRARCD